MLYLVGVAAVKSPIRERRSEELLDVLQGVSQNGDLFCCVRVEKMTSELRIIAAAAAGALLLSGRTGALGQVAPPLLPPPFVNAPTNDDPRAGQFLLTFDERGRLFKVGRAPIGSSTVNYPVFNLPTSTRPAGTAGSSNAQLIQRTVSRVRRMTPPQ